MTDDIREEWKYICDAYYKTGYEQGKFDTERESIRKPLRI